VVVDQFTKLAHFIIAKSIVLTIDVAKLFICENFYMVCQKKLFVIGIENL
jgi:hypothetical protein